MEYRIKKANEDECFCYYPFDGSIGIGMKVNTLNDDELSEFISDSLTHEHIHNLMHTRFNHTVSKLFDSIGKYFRNHTLLEKYCKLRRTIDSTYKGKTHESLGFKHLLKHYGISTYDRIYANMICRRRKTNE